MTPYNPALFTPPAPTQFITANITSPEWSWTAGTTWQITSQTLFGTNQPGTFKITNYNNGYYWGLGAAPLGSTVGNFTVLGSITPEGIVLFNVLNGGDAFTSLTGSITGDSSTGAMALRPYTGSGGPFGSASLAGIMPVSAIATGQTYFLSNVGSTVIPAFTGGTLQVDTMGQIYVQNFTIDGSTTNILDQRGNSTVLTGVLSDAVSGVPGMLTIANSGVGGQIVLTGVSTYSGLTTIDSGATLIVNGSIASPVAVAGTLGGTGLVGGSTTVMGGGTLQPGIIGLPGTVMTITGNLAFQSGAIYLVSLNSTTTSYANVGGAVTLGGTVNAVFTSDSYLQRSYEILHAGSLSGTFSSLTTNLPANFATSLSYDPDPGVSLNVTAALGSGSGLNVNQQNAANAISAYFNNGGTLPAQFANLFNLTGVSLQTALAQLDGEGATDAEKGAYALMNQFLGLMLDPFVDGRFGSSGGPIGFASDQQASFPLDIALAYASVLKAPPPPSFDQRWTAWGSAFGASSSTNGNAVIGSNNVTASDYGFAGGMDYHATPNSLYGFALAGSGTNWSLAQGLGTGRSDAFQAGVYGKSYWGPAYIGAALAFTNNWFSTNRTALGDDITASFAGQSYGGRLETGYRYGVPMGGTVVGATPYAAIQTQWLHTPTYSETDLTGGGFGLTYNAMTANDTRSELGARFDDPAVLKGMPLIMWARLAWAHDWVTSPALDAVFQALPGASFIVNGATPPKNSALASAGAQYFFSSAWSFTAKFDGEFASGSQTYGGTGTVRYTW